jgi:hypothetical protein
VETAVSVSSSLMKGAVFLTWSARAGEAVPTPTLPAVSITKGELSGLAASSTTRALPAPI